MVYATRHVSGSHFNPAISFALAVYGRLRYRDVPAYIASQIGGAVAASLLLLILAGNKGQLGATVPTVTLGEALAIEIAITALLALVVAIVTSKQDLSSVTAGLGVGGAVCLGAVLAGPLTGGSMNPARSFGPALAIFTFEDQWIYWLGPPLGALLGVSAYMRIVQSNNSGQTGPPRPS
jgi:MIP family channel proteins